MKLLLVLGASGGVGLTAVQLGKLMGAQVIGIARGTEKMEIIEKMGADHVLDSEDPNLINKFKRSWWCRRCLRSSGRRSIQISFQIM